MLSTLTTLAVFVLAAGSVVLPLFGQGVEGSINGTVADQTGSVIPEASIKVVKQDTGLTRTASTSGNGAFTVPLLPPGSYTVTATKAGFAVQERRDVEVLVAQGRTADFTLSPATVTGAIEVTSGPPALETTSGTLGTVIQHQEIVDMPLNGGNFTQLVLLTPGAAPVQTPQQGTFTVQEGAGAISPSVAGQRGQQNNYTLDGALNNSIFINIWAISPPPAAIAEFNVRSHADDPLATVSSGANVNVATRSGTNTPHGTLWEFLRNDKLDARNFFDTTKLPYKQNQFGVAVGGPVMLPHFDGRKKNLWFFFYWEGFHSRQTNSYFASVPTAKVRAGDFSSYLGRQLGTDSLGRAAMSGAIFDPASSRPDASKPGSVLKEALPGNIIPASRFSPAAMAVIQKYYPASNLTVAETTFPNLYFVRPVMVDNDKFGIKFDHRFSNNDTLFGRYNSAKPLQTRPTALPTYGQSLVNSSRAAAAGYTHLLGPATLLTVHYGFLTTSVNQVFDEAGASFISSTHLDRFRPPYDGYYMMPNLTVSQNFTGITQSAVLNGPDRNQHWNADVSTVKGAHSLSAGFMYYHVYNFDDNATASVSFTRNATSLDGFTNSTGLGAASFLLGIPDGISGWRGTTWADFTINWYGGYIQDKWKLTKKLSVSLGLRYDYVAPAHWKDNKVSAIDVNTGQLLIPVAFPPLIPKPTSRDTWFEPDYNGWQPRIGFAYRLTGKTVIRSGFALFQDHNNPMIQQTQAIRISWPWGYFANLTGLANEMPSAHTYDNLPLQESFYDPVHPAPSYAADPRGKWPTALEYNFGIQRQLTPSLAADVNYVGSGARHLQLPLDWNVAVSPGPGAVGPRTPYPQYPTAMTVILDQGTSNYNGLLAKLQKRMSHGVYFLASYTFSKSLDIESSGSGVRQVPNVYDRRSSWGPSDFDIRHLFVLSGSYSVPVGKGQRFLASPGKLIGALLGGWRITGIQSMNTGLPFSISAGGDIANIGASTAQRAQLVGDPHQGFTQSRLQWFNRTAFKTPTQYTFGNSGKNIMRGPRQVNLDFGAHKEFAVTERAKLQFRGEFFNALNHTRFGLPGVNVQGGNNLGLITTAQSPRIAQFALRLSF
jgi:hypothetical protein